MQESTCLFEYTNGIPYLLDKFKITLLVSTYKVGRLMFIMAKDNTTLAQQANNFKRPMGIAEFPDKDKIAIACKDEITVLSNSKRLAKHHSIYPGKYDAIYTPQASYYTNSLNIHDLSYGKDGILYAVNTMFSTIVTIDDDYNFTPYWTPPFISRLTSEDRCHLNGMAMKNGVPKYATAFNDGDSKSSWRDDIADNGILIDMETNEIILDNLPVPHSPAAVNEDIYLLLSGAGEFVKVDKENNTYTTVYKTNRFLRGLSIIGQFAFIGVSSVRKDSLLSKAGLFDNDKDFGGLIVVHINSGKLMGELNYTDTIDEVYDIHILKSKVNPSIVDPTEVDYIHTPDFIFCREKVDEQVKEVKGVKE